MKLIKKVLSTLICISMLLSLQVFSLEFPDVEKNNKNAEAIDVLSSLGIIKGYEDGQFKPNKEVTRAELTSLLMRLLNLSITGTSVADSGYTDVANNHWAVYDIKTASNMGIIKGFGDGTFGPEAPVTFEQAVKMVVAMLGYESVAIEKGGWPDGYLTQGRDLGILKNAEMDQKSSAPRKIIAQLLYNSLEVDLMEEEKSDSEDKNYYIKKGHSLMSDYMKISKVSGIITANSKTRLDNTPSQLSDDKIEITSNGSVKDYKVGNFEEIKDLLGLNVTVYTKYDEYNVNEIIQHYKTSSKMEETIISADDINTFTRTNLSIINEINGKVVNHKIDDSAIFMYNGKVISREDLFNNNLEKPTIGSVKLINNGGLNNYVEIESYKNYLVKSVDNQNYLIYVDNTVGDTTVSSITVPVEDKLNYNITIKKDSNDVSLSSIKKGNIISVKETVPAYQNGVQNIGILVSDVKKSGKITGQSDETVTLDSKEYKISPFLNGTSIKSQIVYNANGTFYIDAFDKIAYVEFAIGNTFKYGYILNAGVKTSGDGNEANVKLFDYSSNSIILYDFNNKVEINGTTTETDMNQLMDYLQSSNNAGKVGAISGGSTPSNTTYAQPIKYALNSQNKISEIVTLDTATDTTMNTVIASKNAKYNSTNKYFSYSGGTIRIDSKTVVIEVPKNRFDNEGYAKRTYSYFKNNYPYEIHAIGTSETGTANIILVYEPAVDRDVNYSTPTYIVKSIKTVSENDELKTKLTLINFQTAAESTINASNASYVANVEVGDVIRFGKDTKGEINDKVYIYLDISKSKETPKVHPTLSSSSNANDPILVTPSAYPLRKVMMNNSYEYYAPNRDVNNINGIYAYIYGTPYSISQNSIELTELIPGESGFDTPVDAGDLTKGYQKPAKIATLTATSSTMFYTINDSNEITITKGATDNNDIMGTILTYADQLEATNYIFTYIIDESLKAVYIIK